jgi:peptidoglycan hydrolase CwlO-like protein
MHPFSALQLRKSCVRMDLANKTLQHNLQTLNSQVSAKQAALEQQQATLKAQQAAYEAQLVALTTKLESSKAAALQEQQDASDTQLFMALEQQAEEHAAECKALEGAKAAALHSQAQAFEAQLLAALDQQAINYETQLAYKCNELQGVKAALEKRQVGGPAGLTQGFTCECYELRTS